MHQWLSGHSGVCIYIICFLCCFGDELMQWKEGEQKMDVQVIIEDDTIIIKKDKLIFEGTMLHLFDNNLIEHNFKNNDKILHILKNQNKFKHYERSEALFIVYDLEFFDMDITLRIPLNLFQLDLENCAEADQLKYYKQKSLKLEKIIEANDLASSHYDIHFHKNSIFTVFTEQDLLNNKTLIQQYYHSVYYSVSKDNTNGIYLLYRQVTAKNDDSSKVAPFGEHLLYLSEDSTKIYFLRKNVMKRNFYFKLMVKQNALILNASFALNINILNQFEYPISEQQLLDTFSKDVMIGKLKNYDILNTFYSNEFNIYLSFTSKDGTYACHNFYRFTVNAKGELMLNYLYSVEHGYTQSRNDIFVKKVKNPKIRYSAAGTLITYQELTVMNEIMETYKINCHSSQNRAYATVTFFAFNTVLKPK